ncbi:MAG: ubiquinol-cytochrome c reductase iron-sulfur subunit [Anaerolineae bacterium]
MSQEKAITKGKESITGEASINRREFLNYAWLASLGIFLAEVGGVTYLFSMPRFREGEFGGEFRVGQVKAYKEGEAPNLFREGKFYVVRLESGVLALYQVCTHLGCLVPWQEITGRFECPCHGSKFEKDGTYISGPAPRSLDRFVVRLVDAQGREMGATDRTGKPLPIVDENAFVIVDTGKRIFGEKHA